MTPSGIEPVTHWLVAQCQNWLPHIVPIKCQMFCFQKVCHVKGKDLLEDMSMVGRLKLEWNVLCWNVVMYRWWRRTCCLHQHSRWVAGLSSWLKQQVSLKCQWTSTIVCTFPFLIQQSSKLPLWESRISLIIEMDLKETGLDYVGWICLAQDSGQVHAVINLGMDVCFP